MKRIIYCVLLTGVLLAMALPALAQDDTESSELLTGYRLGKYHATATMLAGELMYIVGLTEDLGVANITDANYEAGLISDEDVDGASMVLAYTIWRAQGMVLPLCEGGLEEDALSDPILADLRLPTQELLTDLQGITNDFMGNASFDTLVVYTEWVKRGDYINRLIGFSDQAMVLAGEQPEVEVSATAEETADAGGA